MSSQTNISTAPSHNRSPSLSRQISALGAKFSRALSTDGRDSKSIASTTGTITTSAERSVSRGRDAYQSSGRGGAGNIRLSSQSRDRGTEEFSPTRGRELAFDSGKVASTGRGGAGNIRSPSRDDRGSSVHPVTIPEHDKEVIQTHNETDQVHSSGRGGLGNIGSSRSRSRAREGAVHSTGRGGAGNIKPGGTAEAELNERAEDDERKLHNHVDPTHSTGRGGAANVLPGAGPGVEHHAPQHEFVKSSGRGGAGNIRNASKSRDPEYRDASREKSGISRFINKVTHPNE